VAAVPSSRKHRRRPGPRRVPESTPRFTARFRGAGHCQPAACLTSADRIPRQERSCARVHRMRRTKYVRPSSRSGDSAARRRRSGRPSWFLQAAMSRNRFPPSPGMAAGVVVCSEDRAAGGCDDRSVTGVRDHSSACCTCRPSSGRRVAGRGTCRSRRSEIRDDLLDPAVMGDRIVNVFVEKDGRASTSSHGVVRHRPEARQRRAAAPTARHLLWTSTTSRSREGVRCGL
jgi:hypothetical protein